MKLEQKYPYRTLDVLLITDRASETTEGNVQIYSPLYQVVTAPTQFFDYLQYIVPAAGSLVVPLNGKSPSGTALHIPSTGTSGPTMINQMWFGVDSDDLAIQVALKGTQEFYLTPVGTYLTSLSSPISLHTQEVVEPVYSYGSDIIPTLSLVNRNPLLPIVAVEPGQGVQVWGYTYQLRELSAAQSKSAYLSGKFSALTIIPVVAK